MLNQKGSIDTLVMAFTGLMVGIIMLYITMSIWQPITSLYLFPMLNNTEAFSNGPIAVTILQLFIVVIAIGLFIWFFKAITGKGEGQPYTGY